MLKLRTRWQRHRSSEPLGPRLPTPAIADVNTPAVATAFLRSANPQLDDVSPLMLLRDADPDEVQKPLLAAPARSSRDEPPDLG